MSSIPGISGAIEVPNTLLYLSQRFNVSIAFTFIFFFSLFDTTHRIPYTMLLKIP